MSKDEKSPEADKFLATVESDKFKQAVARVLPAHLTPERFTRIAITARMRTPKLAECDPQSVLQCLMQLSQFGLEPDGRLAHLIPFWNSKRSVMECQLIIDYKGLANLALRNGSIAYVRADKVCENDDFVYDKGQVKTHTINFKADRGKPYAYYAMVRMKDGNEYAEAMTMDEVKAIRSRSRAKDSGPWVTDFDEMGKKTVFRRLSKWLPLSAEYRDAVEMDADSLEDLRFGNALEIKRAKVPKLKDKDLPVPVLAEPTVKEQSLGEARESNEAVNNAEQSENTDSRGRQDSKKKSESDTPSTSSATTLKRKQKARSPSEMPPNQAALVKLLLYNGYSSQDFMGIALRNEWVTAEETWPLAEGRIETFLTEDNRETIIAELDALKK